MKKFILFSFLITLSGCGSSNEPTGAGSEDTVATKGAVTSELAPTKDVEPTTTPVKETVTATRSESWSCSGGPGSFRVAFSGFDSQVMGTGRTAAFASYKILGDNPFNIPPSGTVEIKREGYEFPNGLILEDTKDENLKVFFFEDSGDIIECKNS